MEKVSGRLGHRPTRSMLKHIIQQVLGPIQTLLFETENLGVQQRYPRPR